MSNAFNAARWISKKKTTVTEYDFTNDGTWALILTLMACALFMWIGWKIFEWLDRR